MIITQNATQIRKFIYIVGKTGERIWKHKKSEVTRFLSSECLRGRKLFPSNWGQFMFFGKIYVLGF